MNSPSTLVVSVQKWAFWIAEGVFQRFKTKVTLSTYNAPTSKHWSRTARSKTDRRASKLFKSTQSLKMIKKTTYHRLALLIATKIRNPPVSQVTLGRPVRITHEVKFSARSPPFHRTMLYEKPEECTIEKTVHIRSFYP